MGTPPWRSAEVELLERLAGVHPLEEICRRMARLNSENGWPVRSQQAIKTQMVRRGLSRNCTLDNISAKQVAECLGVCPDTVLDWCHRLGLPYTQAGPFKFRIKLSKLKQWIEKHPERVYGLDQTGLLFLLNNEKLAKHLSEQPRSRKGRAISLLNCNTGEVFSNAAAAARAAHISKGAMSHHIAGAGRQEFECAGVRWKVLSN